MRHGPPGSEKLGGLDVYRIRQGHYRIMYSIEDDALTVWVVKVGIGGRYR
ncbi:type II toxin-antitoxin system RelE/ParE family toxin [Geobacter sp. DSM 9736]|nr:type II toxin-antitoxin system RelE/ParE family toxin [Geobacter sp. DSM 9736]